MASLLDGLEGTTIAPLERLNVRQYHAMISTGILREGAPIELIDGLLVQKDRRDHGGALMTVGPKHAFTVRLVFQILMSISEGLDCFAQSQQPVTLNETNEPEPDVSLILGHMDDYSERHPGPADVALICEVADTSLFFDRGKKCAIYASSGIPEYWIVDLQNRKIDVFKNPVSTEEVYSSHTVFKNNDKIELIVLNNRFEISVNEILPPLKTEK
ncbi:MAG: Uma2 family endonuclease [Planctomycetaceae bacterium]